MGKLAVGRVGGPLMDDYGYHTHIYPWIQGKDGMWYIALPPDPGESSDWEQDDD